MTPAPRWFRWLLRLLPEPFRARHGEEITDLASTYARGRTPLGRARVWMGAALDVLAVALRARLAGAHDARTRSGWRTAPRRVDGLVADARFGLRSLRRDRGMTVFATLIVGLGVGASVTVFSVVQALLLQPLPFDDPDRLVWVSNGEFGRGQALSEISVQVGYVIDLRAHSSQLDDVAGYHLFDRDGDHDLAGPSGPERVTRLRVSENFFSVLGIEPVHGRLFTPEEAWDDGPPAIALTHGFWKRRFGSDPGVVGGSVVLDGQPTTVVGVLPASFDFSTVFAPGRRVDYVAPYPLSARSSRSGNTLGLIARLAPSATIESATAEAAAIADLPAAERRNGFEPVLRPLREHVSGGFQSAMMVLVASVGLVMLIVCANLSNLLLARGATRETELAVRAALGAGRGRLIQQMLIESVLLAGAGAALGVALAFYGTAAIAALDLPIPLLSGAHVDGAALVVAVLVATCVGLLIGVAPAFQGARVSLHESLKDASRGSSHGTRRGALRNGLVVSEVALACLLLVMSTLLVRSLLEVLEVDLGFDAERAVAVRIDPSTRFASDEARVDYYTRVLEEVGGSPGLSAAGLADMLPMGFNRRWDFGAPGFEDDVYPFVRIVSDGYVSAMGLTLVAGRDFGPEDDWGAPRVGLVNEALAERVWPGQNPVGRTFSTSGRDIEVVGVVRGTRQRTPEQDPGLEMYLALRQDGDQNAVHLIIRGERPLEELVATTRGLMAGIDPTIPLDEVAVLRDIVDETVAPRRLLVWLLGGFAGFAVVLASLGIYGVISYSVAQRRREIGIQIALGASPGAVQSRIVRETLALAAIGLVVGLATSLGGGRLLAGLLYGVAPLDPPTYLVTIVALGGVALLAGYVPARRAARTDPMVALVGDRPRAT